MDSRLNDHAVSIDRLEKSFGRGSRATKAIDGLTLEIPRGQVYGLLGPNGAGKSTLLRIVAGLVRPHRGTVRIFGEPASTATRRRLGMLIEAPAFYPFLTAREHLEMYAPLANARKTRPYGAADPAEPEALLHRMGIAHAADKRVAGFSLGMKQRLAIACALLGRPEIVILDEPTNGLDPDGITEIRSLILELAARDGITVLLSSHLLDEVERVCDRVAILRKGRLAAEGRVADLLDRGARFWMALDRPEALRDKPRLRSEPGDGGVYIRIGRDDVPGLIAELVRENVRIYEAKWIKPDLEAVFLSQTREERP